MQLYIVMSHKRNSVAIEELSLAGNFVAEGTLVKECFDRMCCKQSIPRVEAGCYCGRGPAA